MNLGPTPVPDGRRGPWTIDTFTIDRTEAAIANISGFANGTTMVMPGTFRRLHHAQRGIVMSNTRMEVVTNLGPYLHATGRVLVFGLGLGMLLDALLRKPAVTFVRVVEIDPDVIALVAPTFVERYGARVEIVQADARAYLPDPAEPVWDYVWADIWDEISHVNLPDMARFGRRWNKRVAKKFEAWSRDYLRREARAEGWRWS